MKYCINCGSPLPDEAKFCSNCGFRQPEKEQPKVEEPVVEEEPVVVEAEPVVTEPVELQKPSPVKEKHSPLAKILLAIGGLFAAAGLFIIGKKKRVKK